jgi:hypothetical protein
MWIVRHFSQTATTADYQEHLTRDHDWREGEICDDLAAQFSRLAQTFGSKGEWHRSESRRKTQRGPASDRRSSQANSSR